MNLQRVAVSKLRANPKNPRIIKDEKFQKLVQSIKDFPEMLELRPIVVNAAGVVLGGNMRLKACQAAGLTEVPVIAAESLTEAQEREFVIKDNVGFGEWEWDALANEWDADQLTAWGLDLPSFEAEPAAGQTDPDEVPEAPVEPIIKPGDLIALGDHRLLCGDSTKPDDMARLLNGQLASMIFTDPPYALFGNSTGVSGIADDKMIRPFFRAILSACRQNTVLFGHIYVCCDWHSASVIETVAKQVELPAKNLIVWDKGDGGIGAMYQTCHELIWFFDNSPSNKTTTQTEQRGVRTVNGVPNIWRFPRVPSKERAHNAAKPVDLIAVGIENGSDVGQIVLDLFLGSGSTLMAAERTGRRCYGMEVEPKYCDVIVKRWQDFTGRTATYADTGQPVALT